MPNKVVELNKRIAIINRSHYISELNKSFDRSVLPPELIAHDPCHCDHQLINTNGVFLQSIGWIICNSCNGVQKIRKPIG